MSPEVFRKRIAGLQERLKARGLSGAFLFYSRDIYYYTGTAQPSYLAVRPDEARLFVRRGWEFASRETNLPEGCMVREGSLERICREMFPGGGGGERIGTELDLLPVLQARGLAEALNGRDLADVSPAVLEQRAIKDPAEIKAIRRACDVVHAGHLALVRDMRAGMSELEVSAIVEDAQRRAGHDGATFQRMVDIAVGRGAVASGPNLTRTSGVVYTITGVGMGSATPLGASRRAIGEGDLVVVDIPACVDGYHADQSRTYAVGRFPARAVDLFGRLRDVADHLVDNLVPGITAGEAYALAHDQAARLGLAESFLAFASQPQAHFIGHGVGLEINEPPVLARGRDAVLAPGMVLAVEMHAMEANGPTVKLEDMVLVGPEGGAEMLSQSPRELTLLASGG